jgi:hypothetical protein
MFRIIIAGIDLLPDYRHRGPWPQRWGSPLGVVSEAQQQVSPNFRVDVQASRWLGEPGRSSCCSPQAQVCRVVDSFLSSDFMDSLDAGFVSFGIHSPTVRLSYDNYSYAHKWLKPFYPGRPRSGCSGTPAQRPRGTFQPRMGSSPNRLIRNSRES